MGQCSSLVKPQQKPQPQQVTQHLKVPEMGQTQKQQVLSAQQTLSQAAMAKIPWKFITELSHYRATNETDMLNRFQIEQPDLQCSSENKAVYICLFKGCLDSQNCLRCARKDCPTCTKEHLYHGNKFHLEELTKQLQLRACEQKKILNKLEEVEARLIDDIVTRKLTDFNKFNVAGLDQSYAKVIKAIYVQKDKSQINGMLLNDITYMLSDINEKLAVFGEQLLKEFTKEANSLALKWQGLEKDIIDRLLTYPKVVVKPAQYDLKMQQLSVNLMAAVRQLQNPHNSQFRIEPQRKVKISYDGQNKTWCNFIKSGSISINNKYRYRFNVQKTKNGAILLGIANKKAYGLNGAFRSKQVIAYRCQDGYLYEGGVGTKKGRKIVAGQMVTIDLDTAKYEIQWSCGGQILAKSTIPKQLFEESVYLVALMYNKGDMISLLPQ